MAMYAPTPKPPATATFPLHHSHSKTQPQLIMISPIDRPSHPHPQPLPSLRPHPDEAESSFRDFADARLRKSNGPLPFKPVGVRPQLRIVTAFPSSDPTPLVVHRPRMFNTHVQETTMADNGDDYSNGVGVCCTAPLPHHYTQRSNINDAQYNYNCYHRHNFMQGDDNSNRGHTRIPSMNKNREAYIIPIQPHSPLPTLQPVRQPRKSQIQIQIQAFQPSRGHKRRLSDKFKTLIHKVRRRGSNDVDIDMVEVGDERRKGLNAQPSRMSEIAKLRLLQPEVEQVLEADVEESGVKPQSQFSTVNDEEIPIRPHRSPGTASFLVSRYSDFQGTAQPSSNLTGSGSVTATSTLTTTAETRWAHRGWMVPLTQSRSAFVHPHPCHYSDREMDIRELQSRFSFSTSSGEASTSTYSDSSISYTSSSTPFTPRLGFRLVDQPAFSFNDHEKRSPIGSQRLLRRMSV